MPNRQKLHTPVKNTKEKLHKSTAARYLIFYICKFVFIFFVIYHSKNTSLERAAIGARNMEAYDVYTVTNSHIFISTFWFYSHNTVKLILTKNTFFFLCQLHRSYLRSLSGMMVGEYRKDLLQLHFLKNLQHLDAGDSQRWVQPRICIDT